MKQKRPHRKIVTKRKLRAQPEDLAQRYREVRELRRKLEAVAAEVASLRPRQIEV